MFCCFKVGASFKHSRNLLRAELLREVTHFTRRHLTGERLTSSMVKILVLRWLTLARSLFRYSLIGPWQFSIKHHFSTLACQSQSLLSLHSNRFCRVVLFSIEALCLLLIGHMPQSGIAARSVLSDRHDQRQLTLTQTSLFLLSCACLAQM